MRLFYNDRKVNSNETNANQYNCVSDFNRFCPCNWIFYFPTGSDACRRCCANYILTRKDKQYCPNLGNPAIIYTESDKSSVPFPSVSINGPDSCIKKVPSNSTDKNANVHQFLQETWHIQRLCWSLKHQCSGDLIYPRVLNWHMENKRTTKSLLGFSSLENKDINELRRRY